MTFQSHFTFVKQCNVINDWIVTGGQVKVLADINTGSLTLIHPRGLLQPPVVFPL